MPKVLGSLSLLLSISIRREEESAAKSLNPNWVVDFTEGKGSFKIDVQESPSGFSVKLNFKIFIHENDKELLALIINYFHCGASKIEGNPKGGLPYKIFTVINFEDVSNIIITFFKNIPYKGWKDWV